MTSRELMLNIAINLARIGRFAAEGRQARLQQFLKETKLYLRQLQGLPLEPKLEGTQKHFENWLNSNKDTVDSEEAYTWANILTHRAQLAA